MEQQGWVKFYREWLDNPYICKDGDHMAVWMYLMLNATHKEKQVNFGKQVVTLKAGQLLISKRGMSEELQINRQKINRIFSSFESVSLIVSQSNMHQTLVTIESWASYQNESVSLNVQQVCHNCVTNQETENEKEKRSKREKDKEKEINKNEKNERIYIPPYIPPLGEMDDEFSPLSEKDLDRWLEEDDGIDDWDKMQLYYKQLQGRQPLAVSSQQDSFTGDNEADSFALTNPINQNQRNNIELPPKPPSFANGEITPKACMSSSQRDVCNQPQGCMEFAAGGDTPPSPVTDMFEEFWKAYPKKVGKGYAFDCFKKIRVSRSLLDTMLEAIAKQKKSNMWKRDKGQYIPNPSTWLNQKRWEDDLDGEADDKPKFKFNGLNGLEF